MKPQSAEFKAQLLGIVSDIDEITRLSKSLADAVCRVIEEGRSGDLTSEMIEKIAWQLSKNLEETEALSRKFFSKI